MIYKFKCPKCWEEIEITESMVNIDKIKPLCHECEVNLTRIYTSTPVHFHGEGWTKGAKK